MTDRFFLKIFLSILLIGILFRFTQLGSIPVSLYWDEAAMLVDAKVVSQTGHDMHGNPWYQLMYPSYGDYKLPVYIWFASLSVKVFGVSAWALRLPSALAGIGTIITTGLIARYLFKDSQKTDTKLIQLFTMTVVAFSPWSILFSRTAFEGHLAQFFVSISILLFLWLNSKIVTQHKTIFSFNKDTVTTVISLLFVALLGAIATYTYFSVRFVWPVIIIFVQLFFLLKLISKKAKPLNTIKITLCCVLIPLISFSALLIPMVNSPLYQASNQFRYSTSSVLNSYDYPVISNQLREMAGNNIVDRFFFHRHLLLLKELAKNYSDHLSFNYLFISGDSNLRHGTGTHGLFLIIFLPIFIYGIFKLFLNNKRALLVLTGWWMIALLPASVPETTPHALRSLNALVPLSIIIAYGLTQLVQFSLLRTYKLKYRLLLSVFIGLFLLNAGHFFNHYFVHYPKQSAHDWQDGYQELALTIDQVQDSVTTVWVEPFEGRFYLWLLAFGDYSGQEIQAITKENYMVSEVGTIKIAPYDWQRLKTNSYKVVVAGETTNIMSEIEKIQIQPNWLQHIHSHDGVARFTVAEFGN